MAILKILGPRPPRATRKAQPRVDLHHSAALPVGAGPLDDHAGAREDGIFVVGRPLGTALEAAVIAAVAAAIGLGAGVAVGWWGAGLVPLELVSRPLVPLAQLVMVGVASVAVAALVSLAVARRATQVAPAEAGRP